MNNLKTKEQNVSEDSETISVLSVSSETAQENLTENETTKKKKIKTSAQHVFKTDSDSSDIKLKRTSKSYDKRKVCTSKTLNVESEKKKKLVKRKRREIDDESESDSDSEAEEVSVKQKQDKHEKSTGKGKGDVHVFDIDSDSENETLDKIAGKRRLKHVSKTIVLDKRKIIARDKRKIIASKNNEEKIKKKTSEKTKESSSLNTPSDKKKVKRSVLDSNSDSEISTGDTLLVRKKVKKHSVLDTDSESENGTFSVRKQSEKDKDKFNKRKHSKSSTNEKDLGKGKFSKSSESSSGDTPLAQLKKNKKALSESEEAEETKSKTKKSLECDSDESFKDTASVKERKKLSDRSLDLKSNGECNPDGNISETSVENSQDVVKEKKDVLKASVLKQQENHDHEKAVGAKRKRKLSENSNVSKEGTPDIKKGKKQKLDTISSEENDSKLSDVSTGDTPLVKKKFKLRKNNTNMNSDHSAAKDTETKKSGRKMKLRHRQDSDTPKVEENTQSHSDESSEDEANCDNKPDNDSLSPIKTVKGHRKTVTRLDSSSDEESQNKKPSRKKVK